MTYILVALAVLCIVPAAGFLLAAIDPGAPPPRPTTRTLTRPPLVGGIHPPGGNQRKLEAAPHRGRLIAWSGSIWRSR